MKFNIILIYLVILHSNIFYSQGLPIIGAGDAANYRIANYDVPGSSGLDLHWYGGIRFGDSTSNTVMQIVNGKVGIGTATPTSLLDLKSANPILSINTTVNNSLNGISFKQNDVEYSYLKYNTFSGELRMYANPQGFGGFTSFYNNNIESMRIVANGNVGIGTTIPDSKLTVNGTIHATEVKVTQYVPADYVFEKYYLGESALKPDYTLLTLSEIEKFTETNHHLPNVPSAKEIKENGLLLGEMSNVLLQKIEELTLYMIEQSKQLKAQNNQLQLQKEKITLLEEKLKQTEPVAK